VAKPRPPAVHRRGPFTVRLWRYPGKGGWVFAPVPATQAPAATRPWGRTPVTATVDGVRWSTSVWRDAKSNRSLLAVPKRVRGAKDDGNAVTVLLEWADDD
jgi:hypothetical protein